MNEIRPLPYLNGLAVLCILILTVGCAGTESASSCSEKALTHKKGHLFEEPELRTRGFETAVYLAGKIGFELKKRLQEKNLLAGLSHKDKTLRVKIEVEAVYAGFARDEYYSKLESWVRVVDSKGDDVIAERLFHGFNAYGSVTSDFTEQSHAKEIADFLEHIVR